MDLISQNIITEMTLIEHRRMQFNISIVDISKDLNISRATYYSKINGDTEFKISELVHLGRLYGDNYKDYIDNNGYLVKGQVLLN